MIRVIVCDDLAGIRRHIISSLKKAENIEVVGEAASGEEATKLADTIPVDIILMDIQMEYDMAGLDAIKIICEKHPEIKIIVLTVHSNDDLILEAYCNGAVDYLLKTSDSESICKSIEKAYENDDFIGALISRKLRSDFVRMKRKEESVMFFIHKFTALTKTEKEILKYLYDGHSKKDIAEILCIELSTINVHRKHILKKLGYTSLESLVTFLKKIKLYEEFNL